MTTLTSAHSEIQTKPRFGTALSDTVTITRRNIIRVMRVPDSIFFGIVQNVMFVLLFTYVFGGAITVPGGSYVEFLMAGIFVQTVAFTCAITTITMAEDLQRGIIDRFRSLPMAKGAVLAGRTVADLMFSFVTITALVITGLLVGWRTHSSWYEILGGFALLFLFAYAFMWIGAVIGMSVRSPEVAQTAGLIWLFPLTFISCVFVPIETMPTWLQPVAAWNPISCVTQALRELFGNLPTGYDPGDWFPLQHAGPVSVVWCVALMAVFIPFGVSRYRKAASR